MSDLKDLIARQRAKVERPRTESVDVVLGDELVSVAVSRVMPDDWQQLVAAHPPRTGVTADANMGYNQNTLPRAYPADRISVGGKEVSQEDWAEIYSVLESVDKNNIHTTIWGVNVFSAIKELQALGKAGAGSQSSLPANRAYRRAGSKASSPQK